MKQKEKTTRKSGGIIIIVGILIAVVSLSLFVFEIPGFWAQILAIIASAFLGAGATSWMTNRLLERQQEAEEAKEKNVKIHQSKIAVYSEFVREMWRQAGESDIPDNETLKTIRGLIFNRLIFYLNIEEIEEIRIIFDKDKLPNNSVQLYSQITNVVRQGIDRNIEIGENNNNGYTDVLKELWQAITKFIPPEPTNETDVTKTSYMTSECHEKSNEEENKECEKVKCLKDYGFQQAWHFAMFGDGQLNVLGTGKINELSLIEYEEDWRTNMVKQIGKNDIIFLFRRGGYGYIGAFKPLGWRVFEYEDDKLKEVIHKFNGNDESRYISVDDTDIEKYDIYGGIKDGADLCTNLIVEPIAYKEDGFGMHTGGVYRRTISRYYEEYAVEMIEKMNQFSEITQ